MAYLIKYGKRKLFKRGITVSATLLNRCNLSCDYCSLKNFGDVRPQDPELKTAEQWIKFIETFPIKIREVYITGGEPSLFKGIDYLCNYLIDEGYFVTVFSNLTSPARIFNNVKKSARFKISATYHSRAASSMIFNSVYMYLSNKHRIDVSEIGTDVFPYSNKIPFTTIENEQNKGILRIAPDFSIYTNCYDRNEAFIKKAGQV